MVRFAVECKRILGDVTAELVDTLGEDTATLRMRIGLHSGAVTAGVLRGEKARFQLFVSSPSENLGVLIDLNDACIQITFGSL